ncbi:hypothetical protein AK812_SmicGene49109 [Symbiodinium microadriaticum]|uniref:Uncharacterized protein n=1 Tax=Symbiodinium microadriaticum TaxID=2951 RepID=A0A1Q9C551_SYMMI|nr:hypothetical protein AK812_SmicGene49109 [Symbiodinium microadriaticum]
MPRTFCKELRRCAADLSQKEVKIELNLRVCRDVPFGPLLPVGMVAKSLELNSMHSQVGKGFSGAARTSKPATFTASSRSHPPAPLVRAAGTARKALFECSLTVISVTNFIDLMAA